MDELFGQLAALFSVYEVPFEQENSSAARALAALQVGLYEGLTSSFTSVGYSDGQRSGSVDASPVARSIFEWIMSSARSTPATITTINGKLSVVSILPILDDASTHRLIAYVSSITPGTRTGYEAREFPNALAGALLRETREFSNLPSAVKDGITHGNGLRILACMSEYISTKSAVKEQSRSLERFAIGAAEAKGQLDNYRADFERDRLNQRAELDALSAAGVELRDNQKELRESIKREMVETSSSLDRARFEFDDAIQSSRNELENLKTSIRAEMELNTMRVLWSDRAREARTAFAICIFILALMSGGALATVLCWGRSILDFVAPFNLRTIVMQTSVAGSISQQLGRVVLVSTPIIIFFWMMKIVVRMLIRSVLIMDDARQRQTIMDSYFLLTKEGMNDERALPMMLWALFRQVPGHGSDGIEPPDFTEALNAGLKTGILGRGN